MGCEVADELMQRRSCYNDGRLFGVILQEFTISVSGFKVILRVVCHSLCIAYKVSVLWKDVRGAA